MKEQTKCQWCLWLDSLQKIASFHPVPGFARREFFSRAARERCTAALTGAGYRFQ